MAEKAAEHMTEQNMQRFMALLDDYRGKKGNVIPVLQQTQEIFGYLPKDILIKIGEELDIPISRIYGVVTFYAQFHLKPRGYNIIRSCQGTACHVRGAKLVLAELQKQLGLDDDHVTTPDRKYTLEKVACIGACGLAPVMMINDNTHGRLSPEAIPEILAKYA